MQTKRGYPKFACPQGLKGKLRGYTMNYVLRGTISSIWIKYNQGKYHTF
jgi:hypothetical protein